jgi:hypothetical protein
LKVSQGRFPDRVMDSHRFGQTAPATLRVRESAIATHAR